MSKFIEGMIECPFYLKEGDKFIACEGIAENSKCFHRFTDNKQKRMYEYKYCCTRNGEDCHYNRTMASLYERGLKN